MTQDFFMAQLRVVLLVTCAYCAGAGYLSTETNTFIGAVSVPLIALFGPWAWSLYRNANMKLVPKNSVAVTADQAEVSANGTHAVITGATTLDGGVLAKVVGVLLFAFILSAFLAGGAQAQTKLKLPIDPLGLNSKPALNNLPGLTGAAVTDIQSFLNAKFLPDLQYALKLAQASKNNITADCYLAWIDIITTQQNAVKADDGSELPMPDPHVITEFEKLVELRNALQPESPFMVKCSPIASMVKKDIAGFMGIVVSGGAGLATLIPGL